MKIRPATAELSHADGQAERHDDANSRFRNFANAPKNQHVNVVYGKSCC